MVFKAGIRIPFDKLTPAYDLEFHPSVMSFRAPGQPRCDSSHGATIFTVYDTHKVIYHNADNNEIKFTFNCLPSEYEEMQKIYANGRKNSFGGV